jgi:hypothetical protein
MIAELNKNYINKNQNPILTHKWESVPTNKPWPMAVIGPIKERTLVP